MLRKKKKSIDALLQQSEECAALNLRSLEYVACRIKKSARTTSEVSTLPT